MHSSSSQRHGRSGEAADPGETVDAAPVELPASELPAPPRVSAEMPATVDHPELVTVERRHYIIAGELAKGGMGRILDARDRRLGRAVAIKELLPKNRDASRRFEQEARITARLQHPSIIHVYEAGVWPGGEPFYAMPKVAGRSLDKVVAERPTPSERLALIPNAIAVVDALAYAHSQRVIHRDLKPANVLVGEFGETVVIDWGLAKDLASPDPSSSSGDVHLSNLTTAPLSLTNSITPGRLMSGAETIAGAVVGTPAYMPPEQARGESVDERADVYALGALLYHVLVGAAPYTGKSSRQIIAQVLAAPPAPLREREPGVPGDLVAIVEKAMARDPAKRYADAGELAQDLKRFQTGQLVAARRYSARARIARWLARHRAVVGLGLVALATLAVIAILSVRRIVAERTVAEQRRVALLEEQGRSELLVGHSGRALVYLAAAYREGRTGGTIQFLLREAMRPFSAQVTAIDAGGVVHAVDHSPDGAHVVTADDNGGVRIWSATGAAERVLDAHTDAVRVALYDPTGRWLVTAGDDGARIWDVATWTSRVLAGHSGGVRAAAVSPDGARFATAGEDGTARLWDAATAAPVGAPLHHDGPVGGVAFSADGARVVTASDDGTARVWHTRTGALIAPMRGHKGRVVAARLIAGGTIAITAGDDGTARVWNAERGTTLLAAPLAHRAAVTALVVSADERRVVTGSADNTAILWELPDPLPLDGRPTATARLVRTLTGHDDAIADVALGGEGDAILATTSFDGSARLWDARTGEPLALFQGHRMVKPLSFSPDASRLVTGGRDGTARIWDTTVRPARHAIEVSAYVGGLAVTPDGRTVATGTSDGEIEVRDAATGTRTRRLDVELIDVTGLAFSADGTRLLGTSSDGMVEVWEVATGARLFLRRTGGVAVFAAQTPVTSDDARLAVWDNLGHGTARTLPARAGLIALAASPDGHTIAGVSPAHAEVWDRRTGTSRTFETGSRNLAVALSADGRWLVTAGDGDVQEIWDLSLGRPTAIPIEGPTGVVRAVAITPDATRVITAGDDRVISIWDRATGKLLATRRGHGGPITALAIAGDELWSASTDETARAWDIDIARITPRALDALIEAVVPWRLAADDKVDRRGADEMRGGAHGERQRDRQ
jgi:WD40 repeat protein/tRNA A-37 threonylcarbamoyl transferase component Bud32